MKSRRDSFGFAPKVETCAGVEDLSLLAPGTEGSDSPAGGAQGKMAARRCLSELYSTVVGSHETAIKNFENRQI